jgi:hypothetical protein
MNRRFWSGALIISLLVTAAAAFYVFTQVQNKEIISMLPVEPAAPVNPAPDVATTPEATTSTTTAVSSTTVPAPSAEPLKTDNEPETPVQKRNILFSLPRPRAKAVFIIGDFNDWKEQAMTKKDNKWQLSVALEPGSYKYMFVVDKKQMRDPNNKLSAGGKSLITVKPLSSSK